MAILGAGGAGPHIGENDRWPPPASRGRGGGQGPSDAGLDQHD